LERLAEDSAKMARHCGKIKQRREAIAKGTRVPDGIARIVSMERLSSGLLMFAWEGKEEFLYGVSSYDLGEERWQDEGDNLLVDGGVVEWAGTVTASSKYYHLWSMDGLEVPEEERLKGEVSFRKSGGVPVEAVVKVSFLDGRPADGVQVTARIDGEGYDSLDEAEKGVYRVTLPDYTLLPGRHFFSVRMENLRETTPSGNERGRFGGYFRTPTVYFEFPAELPRHSVGFTELLNPPDHSRRVIVAELAPHYGAWEIEVFDPEGRKVKGWKGETDRKQGSSLSIPWTNRDEKGEPLPTDFYQARLTAEFEENGKTVRRCIARLEELYVPPQ
jgi:hypothetical protein